MESLETSDDIECFEMECFEMECFKMEVSKWSH